MTEEHTTAGTARENEAPAPGKNGSKRKHAGLVLILLVVGA